MRYVSSVHYLFQVRGAAVGDIWLERGLRQDDPLSPFLFLIVAKGLSTFLKQVELSHELKGIVVVKRAPVVSHLLFVDDNFFFGHASPSS